MYSEQLADTKQDDGKAMVKHDQNGTIIPTRWLDPQQSEGYVTTLDVSSNAGKRAVLAALQDDVEGIEKAVNTNIELVGFTMHPIAMVDEKTREITTAVRTVIHCKDGRNFKAVSTGVIQSLQRICSLFGNPPWSAPMVVKPLRLATKGGKSRYVLELV